MPVRGRDERSGAVRLVEQVVVDDVGTSGEGCSSTHTNTHLLRGIHFIF